MIITVLHNDLSSKETIGTALYLGPSVMDHSCSPNAAVSFDGVDIVVRSLTNREELDFGATFIRDSPPFGQFYS